MKLEEQLLGRLLQDDKVFFSTGDMINESFFTDPLDKDIFKFYKSQLLDGGGVDMMKISNLTYAPEDALLRIGDLISSVNYSLGIQSLLERVYTKIKIKKINRFREEVLTLNENDPDKILTYINEFVTKFDTSGVSTNKTMYENVDDVLKIIEFNKTNVGLTGIDTGFRKLNKITNGLQGGDLIIVAGETSQGKTSFALNIAQKASEEMPVFLVSCEMMPSQITARMLAYSAEINSNHLLTGRLNEEETKQVNYYSSSVASSQLIISGSDFNIDRIIANIRVLHATKGIKMAILDYLQLINTTERTSQEQKIAGITRRLKNLAKELNIPIMLLSQLNRNKDNPFPKLSRLRDSGQIEEAADIVIFVYRPEYYGIEEFSDGSNTLGRAQIIIAKGRNTGIGTFYVNFNKALTKFTDEEEYSY